MARTFELYLESGQTVVFEATDVEFSALIKTWTHGDSKRRLRHLKFEAVTALVEIVPDDVSQETSIKS